MSITKEDKILIKNLFPFKSYNAKQLEKEVPSKDWNVDSVYKLLLELQVTESVNRRPSSSSSSSSRHLSTLTANIVDLVDNLVLHKTG